MSQSPRETIEPALEVTALGNDLQFVLVIGDNFSKFRLDELRVAGLASKSAQNIGSAINLASLDKVTWGLWEEEKSKSKNQGPEHLESHRNAVRPAVGIVLGAVVDAGGQKKTNRDAELVP